MVQLYGDGHAVAHAFGAGVVVSPIGDVGELAIGVGASLKVDGLRLRIAVEELLEGGLEPGVDLAGLVTVFGEEITVMAGAEGAPTIGLRRCGRTLGRQCGRERESEEGIANERGQHGVSGYAGEAAGSKVRGRPLK